MPDAMKSRRQRTPHRCSAGRRSRPTTFASTPPVSHRRDSRRQRPQYTTTGVTCVQGEPDPRSSRYLTRCPYRLSWTSYRHRREQREQERTERAARREAAFRRTCTASTRARSWTSVTSVSVRAGTRASCRNSFTRTSCQRRRARSWTIPMRRCRGAPRVRPRCRCPRARDQRVRREASRALCVPPRNGRGRGGPYIAAGRAHRAAGEDPAHRCGRGEARKGDRYQRRHRGDRALPHEVARLVRHARCRPNPPRVRSCGRSSTRRPSGSSRWGAARGSSVVTAGTTSFC